MKQAPGASDRAALYSCHDARVNSVAKPGPSNVSTPSIPREAERSRVLELIRRIVDECPRRQATTSSERRAHEILAGALAEVGVATRTEPFRYNDSPHASVALHFGLGTVASAISLLSPATALPLHALSAASYALETTRRALWLRTLLPFGDSQNLIGSLRGPCPEGEPALRIVLVGHIDAALTGLVFDPRLLERFAKKPDSPLLREIGVRPIRLALLGQVGLVALDLLGILLGPARSVLWPAIAALSLPGALTTALALEAELRDEIVPGANDNLTGCAALPVLASRLAPDLPSDVELVLVAVGAEEAGLGGSTALAKSMRGVWDPARTIVLAIDGLTNGELRWFEEGELYRMGPKPRLRRALREAAAGDPRFASVGPFDVGVGGTDAQPFHEAGFETICIGCIDPRLGAPRHYHQPSDTPENLDLDQLMLSLDFVERVVRALVAA